MKNFLITQSTNYDCGPTSMMNAIRYLFERHEIPPLILRRIWNLGIDSFSEDGELGKAGTSKASMRYMAAWFECFASNCGFPLKAAFFDFAFADLTPGSLIWQTIREGGCAVVRCWHGGVGHYVLVTRILPDDKLGLFDPYDGEPDPGNDPDRQFIYDAPRVMNRAVSVEIMNRQDETTYAMGALDKREILLLWRADQ